MNTLKGIILTLAATCSLSQAQQAGIPALIQGRNIPGGQYLITGVSGKNNFTAVQMRNGNAVGSPIGGRISDCTTFYISTPKSFAEAVDAFRAGKLQQAQQGFAKVKTAYKIVQSIPGNLSVRSALLEIDSAIRLKDWAAVKALAAALPNADLTPENKLHAQVAELLGNIADKQWDAIIENGNKILSSNKNNLTLTELGWLQYAMGRAYQGQLGDSPDLSNRDNVVKANAAIDAYSTTIAASHGSYMELPAEAMGRAALILSLLPEAVGNYAGSLILILMGIYYIAKWIAATLHSPSAQTAAETPRCDISSASVCSAFPCLKLTEVFALSLTLSLNNLSAGLSASLAGLTLVPAAVSTLACSVLFLFAGNRLGRSPVLQLAGKCADPLSGGLLIGLGIMQFFL